MDPIQPIGPRPPWIAELAAAQTQGISRKRRRASGGEDRKPRPRREPPHEGHGPEDERPADDGPEDDGPQGRHIDVRA